MAPPQSGVDATVLAAVWSFSKKERMAYSYSDAINSSTAEVNHEVRNLLI